MNLKRGWRLHSPTEKRQAEADRPFHASLKSPILALNALWLALFWFLRKRLTNRHTGFNRGLFWCCDYSCVRNLESYGCNQIIVLIVPIVIWCLNEAKPFSLFNATQILDIPIGETQGKTFLLYSSSLSSLDGKRDIWLLPSIFWTWKNRPSVMATSWVVFILDLYCLLSEI